VAQVDRNRTRLAQEYPDAAAELAALDGATLFEQLAPIAAWLRPLVTDVGDELHAALRAGRRVLLEGAQGTLLDLDHGTYPFVTSSPASAAGAPLGVGLGPTAVDEVIGVTKAYATRVGHGPFPSEMPTDEAARLREMGEEYGATTGRPRRCGWLDLPALRYAARVNGLTRLVVTKLDVLDTFETIQVCVGYTLDGVEGEGLPGLGARARAVPSGVAVVPGLAHLDRGRTAVVRPAGGRTHLPRVDRARGRRAHHARLRRRGPRGRAPARLIAREARSAAPRDPRSGGDARRDPARALTRLRGLPSGHDAERRR
jgi:adenylosuccinate synthase